MLGKEAQQEASAHGEKCEALKAPEEALHAGSGIGGNQGLREEPTEIARRGHGEEPYAHHHAHELGHGQARHHGKAHGGQA
jgi:hypothetical protein